MTPKELSSDFIHNKKQFHLYRLLTEQRHPLTRSLSRVIRKDLREGLEILLSVDVDITLKLAELSKNPPPLLAATESFCQAIRTGRKVIIYGCGATGRLARQMESTFWRPFWKKVQASTLWDQLKGYLPEDIGERLIGEMTGADRALISSLEGFEDLEIIGKLQLLDRGIEKGDVVFCVTEGGETSSVIGAMRMARSQYPDPSELSVDEARRHLFFIYNNPDPQLLEFDRCRRVIEDPGITRLNLTTGPQALAGSTRMQAATIESFVLGVIMEEAITRLLKDLLSRGELSELDIDPDITLSQRLLSFQKVKYSVDGALDSLVNLTRLESETCLQNHFTTYFAKKAVTTVFTDSTERSPTFRLAPLDRTDQHDRKSWIQIWTDAPDCRNAWQTILGRNFRGMTDSFYRPAFEQEIQDPWLRNSALRSLEQAGDDQEILYDLSFSDFNQINRGPSAGDLGIAVCIGEEFADWQKTGSAYRRFVRLFHENGARVALIRVGAHENLAEDPENRVDVEVVINLPEFPDPLGLRAQIALKLLLNAHSTAIMARLGRVTGNTMTGVNPGNLKLIGRATFLIFSLVNEALSAQNSDEKQGDKGLVSFKEANAVLFECMDNRSDEETGPAPEVALCVIRMLEQRKGKRSPSWDEVRLILKEKGLEGYLEGDFST